MRRDCCPSPPTWATRRARLRIRPRPLMDASVRKPGQQPASAKDSFESLSGWRRSRTSRPTLRADCVESRARRRLILATLGAAVMASLPPDDAQGAESTYAAERNRMVDEIA